MLRKKEKPVSKGKRQIAIINKRLTDVEQRLTFLEKEVQVQTREH